MAYNSPIALAGGKSCSLALSNGECWVPLYVVASIPVVDSLQSPAPDAWVTLNPPVTSGYGGGLTCHEDLSAG